ncbi:MAG: outer membrane protein assembly factor BamE [Rhodospirillaceae bacterium]|nr:outer membrane protein assembly factor BamE [Rhodospirillales bacterium]MBT3907429.1 outer membrane protein assembly factor BamE [Rhodospirillaceae bacterium]MBT4700013.1 outer membrane protein assembly factor BamE [Rhodospirillaceae bacterium]MBT5035340.1 outer membrane protein assembly factor BamE [Rhodospirillaceae bacterium]MBT6221874.1 outer membrane protein assembly factor BamE [Rhodospirillaceae bacterium]
MSHLLRYESISKSVLRHALIGVVAVGILTACSGRIAVRGNVPDPERLVEIQPGEISRGEVRDALGSPSTVGNYEKKETWVYFSEKTETYAFLEPKVIDRKVVIIQFDAKGVVSKVRTIGMNESAEVDPVGRKTPSAGAELTVIDQIIANFQKMLPPE